MAEVIIPAEFDEAYEKYNEIQKKQNLDLSKYSGKRAKRWTYEVKNYPGYENKKGFIQANILIYDGMVIGGDICSVELNGFMRGFDFPEIEVSTKVTKTTSPQKPILLQSRHRQRQRRDKTNISKKRACSITDLVFCLLRFYGSTCSKCIEDLSGCTKSTARHCNGDYKMYDLRSHKSLCCPQQMHPQANRCANPDIGFVIAIEISFLHVYFTIVKAIVNII